MMEEEVSNKRKKANRDPFTDIVFSWSVEDIFNENLYQNQVERIPESFKSVQHYFGSYDYPLLEETRAQLHSTMEIIWNQPFAEVISFEESKPYGTKIYEVKVDYWRNRFCERGKEPYKTLPGDVFILADVKPETVSDLQRAGRSWAFVSVTKITDDGNEDGLSSTFFKIKASKEFELDNEMRSSLFVIFLGNLTPNRRIWKALHMFKNLNVVEKVLRPDSRVEGKCTSYSEKSHGFWDVNLVENIKSKLNESQTEAVLSCLSKIHHENESAFELIWGPPGTGKTKTTGTLLLTLLEMKFRTLICAPTNVAITEVASRVVKVVCEADPGALFCSLGDILLFGNKDRLKVGSDIQDIYLDYRVQKIAESLGSHSGWRHCFGSMINFLEDCVSQYHIFLENEMIKEKEQSTECDIKEKGSTSKAIVKSFREFVRERFVSMAAPLRQCVSIICTHIGKSYISEQRYQNMVSLIVSLESFKKLLSKNSMDSKALEECFSQTDAVEEFPETFEYEQSLLCTRRSECLSLLRTIQCFLGGLTFPNFRSQQSMEEFCFQRASLIFCTASTSSKLHKVAMEPLRVLVIDEAAQLKECESTIPLQLRGIKHAILVGDECQLPAMVQSKISDEAGFGRSLFERLSSQGCAKHLLNMQYRMHPSISLFPNLKFYDNQIVDAPIVRKKSYEIQCLQGSMYGPYSFINIIGGREEKDDDGRSWRNMVEVAIILKILQNLYRAWADSKLKVSIGVVSPYAAQLVAIQDRLRGKYDNRDGFLVKVKTIDGFQGGEDDIIIISSVRSNSFQSVGFISKPQRMNVALTRARHCLWILGNERTLVGSQTVWKDLVLDAKKRNCFFNADDDKDLAKAILEVKKELDQLDDLLNGDSMLFKNSRWKVQFSDNFLKSFKKLTSVRIKKSVLHLLLKLSSGWRPKKRNIDSFCGSSMQIVKQFKVEGLYVVSTTDIVKDLRFIQVLKIWDLLPLEDIPKLIKRLESIFCKYTDDFINLCNEKCLERNLEVPKSWSPSVDIVRFKDLSINETGNDQVGATSDGRSYVENSKVSESLLLMKFYSLSSVAVGHLMSDHDGRELDLPFEVTDQEMAIILFDRSSFILGRSGTGKTTVLTMKLFQKEKLHQMANERFYGIENNSVGHGIQDNDAKESSMASEGTVLRQLFVTVSPKLCFAVKQHVSHLKSFACGGKSSDESGSSVWDYIDDEEIQFKNIPDSFVNIPPNSYPLVITFHKFLMMLDGTLNNSYFERFLNVPELSNCKMQSSRSVLLQNILRTKEVNYERFSSSYWPHFNFQLTKDLDPSRVFTEIISYIKGGLQSMEAIDGKLNREDYVLLSEGRASSLSKKKREIIYDIFQSYEKMKMEKGEYDLADFVIDLHFRLRHERYEGDEMDFVYIDEVQDLTMSQIALFKHVCSNVEEGFVFSGDTAQTIARGIDFRFQDIRNLFYRKFFLQSRISAHGERNEKGLISEVFQLTQNFRTHAGILKLSHSIIELIYRFFPSCIDKLKPESSLIYGEAPILLESWNNENAIIKIFGNSESVSGKIVGFGAEQVILVRDDNVRKEISNYVGKQALVLTILECKGLEFQDVLLYDFFCSSPLKNLWRVIYEYMEEQGLLDSDSPSFPHFNESKHNILCSELKQLYVAVTRTRQRLWICETSEFSKPMFDYWKKKCLVQIMQLDDSLAQAMQVASTPEEWRSRGLKLYSEHNYEMATMCFERAGDTYWERRSKAAGLKSMADRMRISNPEVANSILREAAEIFDAIGKADSAARCFYDLGEYERAGRIYMEKCGESELDRAGECFTRAECYELAAEVYARGNFFSECLNVCARGKLFDMGLDFIQCWKQHATNDSGMSKRGKEIEEIEQKFLESCASHYHEVKDIRAMMKFVWAFSSMDLIRDFLRSKGCFEELREAAEIFDARGKADFAARCFYDLGEYERAGRIYMEKCGESELGRAGECFTRAERYDSAAEVYARGNFVSECLNVCARGKLFDMGLDFIQCWKQLATNDSGMSKRGKDIEKIGQKFLESCASHYHEVKDIRAMTKFVKAFSSMDLIRNFLRSKGCFDELMLLEEESGNFLEAANLAKLKGDVLLEVDLLGKARNFREAATLILLYVLANSLWSHGSKGWPLKQFKQKQELLAKGKSFAKNDSDNFYELFCTEADIIANEQSNLQLTKNQMKASQRHKSISAEMLCVRKILDGHLSSSVSKYIFEEDLVFDLTEHSEIMISKNQVSHESMVYFWNIWKDKIIGVFEYLVHLDSEDVNENESFGEFCLNFLGVRRQFDNLNTSYVLLHSGADWVRDVDTRHFKKNGKLVSIDVHQLASAAQSYWSSELLFVGIEILKKLNAIYEFLVKISDILFCKSRTLTHIYEVAKFLFESKFLKKRYHDAENLQKSIRLSTERFFEYVFPLDWRKSLRENMILLRGMDISKCLLQELIVDNINAEHKLSYGQIGRIAMITLGSGKLKKESCEEILQKVGNDSPWKVFFKILCSDTSEKEREVPLICSFNEALCHTYGANWRAEYDYISPGCFVYLVEHLLIRVSCFRSNFFTTKSSFVEWLMECGEDTKSSPYKWADVKPSLENLLRSMIHVVELCLYNKGEMLEWIEKSRQVKDIYSLIVSRLVVIVCLINLNFGIYQDLLLDLINKKYIMDHLPRDFHGALLRFRKRQPLYSVLAEAFRKIGNDLVIVSSGENFPELPCPASAIHVNMKIFECKNDILRKLFPRTIETKEGQRGAAAVEASDTQKVLPEASSDLQKKSELPQSRLELVAKQEPNTQYKNQVNISNDCRCVWEILDRMKIVDNGGDRSTFLSHAKTIKVDVEKFIQRLSDGLTASYGNTNDSEKKVMLEEVATMTDELKQLSNALDESEVGRDDQISRVEELCNRLQSKRPKMEPILTQFLVLNNTNLADKESQMETVVASSEKFDEVKNTVVDERNADSHKVDAEAAQVNAASGIPSSSSNTDNKVKGNNNKNKKNKAKK